MNLKLKGTGNPGWTFTDERIYQLSLMFEWLNQRDRDEVISFKKFQNIISTEVNELDDSKIRMFFPWLEKYGVISEFKPEFQIGTLLTDLGEKFAKFLEIYLEAKEQSKAEVDRKVTSILHKFVFQFYRNLVAKKTDPVYETVMGFLNERGSISYNEYMIITTGIVDEDVNFEWTRKSLQQLEEYPNTEVEIIKNVNSWGYIVPFLEQAGLVRAVNRVIYPNKKENYLSLYGGGTDGSKF